MTDNPETMTAEWVKKALDDPWGSPIASDIVESLCKEIDKRLDQARKEGIEEGFARGQEKKSSCVCSAFAPCRFHAPMIDAAEERGFEKARGMAAHKVQSFKWSTDNDSEVIEILAHRIRALQPPREDNR